MISSRTPEGRPNRCPVCRRRLKLSPSRPTADAPCPHCGSLVWFAARAVSPQGSGAAAPIEFTLDDFRKQFAQMAKLGGMKDLVSQVPGGFAEMVPEGEDPDAAVKRIQGMIDSMTNEERRNPDVIEEKRRRRIAAGCGCGEQDVAQFLGQFARVRELMCELAAMPLWDRLKRVMGLRSYPG